MLFIAVVFIVIVSSSNNSNGGNSAVMVVLLVKPGFKIELRLLRIIQSAVQPCCAVWSVETTSSERFC